MVKEIMQACTTPLPTPPPLCNCMSFTWSLPYVMGTTVVLTNSNLLTANSMWLLHTGIKQGWQSTQQRCFRSAFNPISPSCALCKERRLARHLLSPSASKSKCYKKGSNTHLFPSGFHAIPLKDREKYSNKYPAYTGWSFTNEISPDDTR